MIDNNNKYVVAFFVNKGSARIKLIRPKSRPGKGSRPAFISSRTSM